MESLHASSPGGRVSPPVQSKSAKNVAEAPTTNAVSIIPIADEAPAAAPSDVPVPAAALAPDVSNDSVSAAPASDAAVPAAPGPLHARRPPPRVSVLQGTSSDVMGARYAASAPARLAPGPRRASPSPVD